MVVVMTLRVSRRRRRIRRRREGGKKGFLNGKQVINQMNAIEEILEVQYNLVNEIKYEVI
jgi:hypothetical protein